ncbi:hypothetical protein NDN08_002574 [Rhodosorus marinus]|uniref:Cytochrome b561 domain-containing protein n=1 Tax=Rhodosorus marinus TaxID=101924 RepID=A0AAV8UU40_9RHOD|nr:hypothetical protein NDN08_002574 [Rhodosorus marinus]
MGFRVAMVLVLVLCAGRLGYAHREYLMLLPNGLRFSDTICVAFGHEMCYGYAETNRFGKDFCLAGYTWSRDFCELDSDKDGFTNGEELGDPCCCWNGDDSQLARTNFLSHPAEKTAIPPESIKRGNDTEYCTCKKIAYKTIARTTMSSGGLHGIIMVIAFGFLMPLSALLMRYGGVRYRVLSSFSAHRFLMIVSLLTGFAGFLVIEVGQKGFLTVTSYHTIAGFVMLFFCFVQEFVALFFRPDHSSLWRNDWRISHLVIGLSTIATAMSVILTGLFIIGASRYSILGFVLTIVVVLTYVGWSERSKQHLELELVPTEPEEAELDDVSYDDSQSSNQPPVTRSYGSNTSAFLFGFVILLMVGTTAALIVDLVLIGTKIPVRC